MISCSRRPSSSRINRLSRSVYIFLIQIVLFWPFICRVQSEGPFVIRVSVDWMHSCFQALENGYINMISWTDWTPAAWKHDNIYTKDWHIFGIVASWAEHWFEPNAQSKYCRKYLYFWLLLYILLHSTVAVDQEL